jgi:hypothetical protein
MIEVREELGALKEQRRRFKAEVGKFGKKTDFNTTTCRFIEKTTILLVCDLKTGKEVSDHCWVTMGKRFESLGLKENDIIAFDARVTTYRKFHRDESGDRENNFHYVDYRLSFPTNLEKVKSTSEPTPAIFTSEGASVNVIIAPAGSGMTLQSTIKPKQTVLLLFLS